MTWSVVLHEHKVGVDRFAPFTLRPLAEDGAGEILGVTSILGVNFLTVTALDLPDFVGLSA